MADESTPAPAATSPAPKEPTTTSTPDTTVGEPDTTNTSVESIDDFWTGEVGFDLEPLPDGETSYKIGYSHRDLIKKAPLPYRQLLANLRADYTRKTQALAQREQELQQLAQNAEKAMFQDRDQIRQAIPKVPEQLITEQMVWNGEATMSDYVKQQLSLDQAERFGQLDTQWKKEQKLAELRNFRQSHPEFENKEFTEAVAGYYKNGMDIEDAYYLVKGKMGMATPANETQEGYDEFVSRNNKETTQRSVLSKLGSSSRAPKEFQIPPGASVQEVTRLSEEYKAIHGHYPKLRKW